MSKEQFFFTSESVTEGHPDKVADQISDAILDAIIAQDKHCRVACETLVTTGIAFVAGEITTQCYVDIPQIVRQTIRDIGYCSSQMGFDCQTCSVITALTSSRRISPRVLTWAKVFSRIRVLAIRGSCSDSPPTRHLN